MKSRNHVLVIAATALALTGCAKSPPKCSDEETLALVRQIIVEQIGGDEGLRAGEIKDGLRFEYARASAYDEKIKKLSCEAKLISGERYQLPLTYESQLDDHNDHIVSVSGIAPGDLLGIKSGLIDHISKARAGAAAKPAATEAAAVTEAPAAGTDISGEWTGTLEGEGHMQVSKSGSGHEVALTVATEGCAGEISGPATYAGNELKLVKTEDGETCTITARIDGNTAEVSEDGCLAYHGMSCGFSGTLQKSGS